MVDRDHTSLASGSIGAVLGPVIGEPLKGTIAALILPACHFVKNGWELKSIITGVNASDCLRLLPEVANCMKDFHPRSDEYNMLKKFIHDSEELMVATIDGRQNYTLYNRGLKSRKILACKERVEADLVAVRVLVEDKRSHYLVPTLDVRKPIVPRESYISALKSLLADEHGPEWILIHGKSGVGKTHLVQYVFQMQEVRQLFGCIAYLEVGRGKDEVSMVMDICSQLRMLPGHSKITNVGEGTQSIQTFANRTSNKVTLIVLENVCNPDILRAVDIKGVRKLVTSHKANVLDQFSRNKITKLEVNPLSHGDACTLFCLHAFGKEEAPEDIRDHVELMVEQCYGVPKVLEIMARYMSKDSGYLYSPTYWEHVLEKIRRGNCDEHEKIFRVLKLSYDDLSNDEKVLFLCIAMEDSYQYAVGFIKSTDVRYPLYYWWLVLSSYEHDDYYHREFLSARKSLEDASLAERDNVRSSQLMLELAEYIIKKDKHPYVRLGSCSGRTSGVEVIYGDMEDMKGEKVSDILSNEMPRLSVLQLRLWEPMHISLESFSNLKFLWLNGQFITICGLELLVQLRYLALTSYVRCWCSYENLLEGLGRLHQLEVLQIHCFGECEGGAHLDFRFLKNMDRLNCLHIRSSRIHPVRNSQYIEKMNRLQVLRLTSGPLDLNNPTFNSSIEEVCLGNYKQHYYFSTKFETVEADPQKFAWLLNGTQKLRILELCTIRFKEVPFQINFPSLVSLQLNIASKYLPNGFESLHHLEQLTLNGGGTLLELPAINKLPNLKRFTLSEFSGKHFPESFSEHGAFPKLESLTILNCQQLEVVTLQQISKGPQILHIFCCDQLLQIQAKGLYSVKIHDCKSLSQLDFVKQIYNRRRLEMDSLPSLVWEEVNPAGFLSLIYLTVKSFTFKHLPSIITLFTGLKKLYIYDCPQLETLSEDHTQFCSLVNLEEIHLWSLPKLICLPDCIETLHSLKIIKIFNCPGIGTVNELVRKEGKLVERTNYKYCN